MPKLFQINVTANWGSHGRIAEDIGRLAQSRGWECHIAYGRGNPQTQLQATRVGTQLDMYLHGLQSRLFDNHGLASKRATRQLVRTLEEVRPDIIHLHNIHGYYLHYPLLFEYLSQQQAPVVWTLHDCWPFTGHCAYFDFADCHQWQTVCRDCPQRHTYPASMLLSKARRNFELKKQCFTAPKNITLVPVSEWLEGLLKQSFLKEFPTRCIHNGVNLDVFRPRPAHVEENRKKETFSLLGVASVWEPRKGLTDFLRLRSLLPDNYRITLIGLSEQQIKQLPAGIEGIRRTDSVDQLVDRYAAADVFVNPTWEDNFPTTNLEALACGTPVVTYCTGGSPEAIDEQTGRVVDKGNVEQLAQTIRDVAQNSDRALLRRACRSRAEQLFNQKNCYQAYLSLYEALLDQSSGQPLQMI